MGSDRRHETAFQGIRAAGLSLSVLVGVLVVLALPSLAAPPSAEPDTAWAYDVWHDTMAAWAPAGSMLDSMEVLGDEVGNYRDEIVEDDGSVVPLRKEHGVHFFEVGADLLAAQLERELVADGWLTRR